MVSNAAFEPAPTMFDDDEEEVDTVSFQAPKPPQVKGPAMFSNGNFATCRHGANSAQ